MNKTHKITLLVSILLTALIAVSPAHAGKPGKHYDQRYHHKSEIYRSSGLRDAHHGQSRASKDKHHKKPGRHYSDHRYAGRNHHNDNKRYHRPYPKRYHYHPHHRRWSIGRPLPRGVVYHHVYHNHHHLRPAPRGYRYVSVDGDILLMSIATGLIINAVLGY